MGSSCALFPPVISCPPAIKIPRGAHLQRSGTNKNTHTHIISYPCSSPFLAGTWFKGLCPWDWRNCSFPEPCYDHAVTHFCPLLWQAKGLLSLGGGGSDDTVVNRATRKKNELYKRSSLLGARRIFPDDGGAQQLIHSEIGFVAACRFFYRARHLYFCLIQDDSVNLLIARTTGLWHPLLKTTWEGVKGREWNVMSMRGNSGTIVKPLFHEEECSITTMTNQMIRNHFII